MVDTIQNAFRSLILVAFILGLGNFRYPLSYWRFRLSVFYMIMVWSFYAFAFYVMIQKFSPINIFDNPLIFTSISTNILVTIISVTITGRKQQVQETKALVHKLTDLKRFMETREQIYQFLLQMSLRPLEFRGMDMFHFGYKFINKFFMWVLSVIVFILQMDTSPMSQLLKFNGINGTCLERNFNFSHFEMKHV
ncbi:PREDICTED: uncharacterized protein LOC105621453 [Atta cephalotes]|uniref:Gustatory receptor n=1 Tax=Atta cephalotes TaxID=12957 RepID=A0A158NLA3_ATTCE|nr:PREDICTED: uncharacterized protein LOC105621453 [Atta cephalotes]